MVEAFYNRGYVRFPVDPHILHWVTHARASAQQAVINPELAQWHQCQGTWFVGVDALANDETGAIGGSGPLAGRAVDFITSHLGPLPALHRAQVSVIYPGYPRPRQGESDKAFAYRRNRDAAHVDGVRAIGPERRRKVLEPHGFILGLPLSRASADAAPLVVWDGSHHIMRRAFQQVFAPHDPDDWPDVDVTDAYQAARREVFATCRRVTLPAQPGETTLVHRLALHGVAPWAEAASADTDGRMIAYFRPELEQGLAQWVAAR